MPQLSIIILSYNTKDLVRRCLLSLKTQYEEEIQTGVFEIIIVDNASTDGSVELIQNSKFKIIKNKENVGFSKGCNIGAKTAKGKYLLFLNSDTEVKDRGLIGMISYMDKNNKVGVIGGKLHNVDGSKQLSAGKFYTLLNVFLMLLGGERLGLIRTSPKDLEEVDWVSGASLMIHKELFNTLKGFDEYFFMYMEDMELCFRVKKKGYAAMFYPHIAINHQERGSSNRSFAIIHIYRGLLYFYKKHKSYAEYLIVRFLLTIKAYIAIVVGICTNRGYLASTYKSALAF